MGKGYMKGQPLSSILKDELGTVAIGSAATKTCGNIIVAAYALAEAVTANEEFKDHFPQVGLESNMNSYA